MFTVQLRDAAMGGEVYRDTARATAREAESTAFRWLAELIDMNPGKISIDQSVAFSNGTEGKWGGEFVITTDDNPDDETLLILDVDDD